MGMAEKTIPWARVEEEFARAKVDATAFRIAMGVHSNVITNWKSRGIPRGRARQVAEALKTVTADELLRTVPADRVGPGTVGEPQPSYGSTNPPTPLHPPRVPRDAIASALQVIDKAVKGLGPEEKAGLVDMFRLYLTGMAAADQLRGIETVLSGEIDTGPNRANGTGR